MNIAILILAAGTSSRMKTCKQLLSIDNTTLLEKAINHAMQSKTTNVYCVLGAYTKEIQEQIALDKVGVIINENWRDGLSSSIVAGVHKLNVDNVDAILVMLADQPFVDTQYLNALITEFASDSNHIIASNYGKRLGVPALFPRQYFNELLQLQGDKGAKELLNSGTIPIKTTISKGNLFDVDTPEDYMKLL